MDIKNIQNAEVLKKTDFRNLGEHKIGKVRDIYTQADKLILIATDRHSSFDRIIAHIPFKGEVLTQVSNFWFEKTKDIIPNHILAKPDPQVVVVKRCNIIPIEVVVRGYITGSTNTSLWSHYQEGKRDFGNFTLPDGMKKNQKLEKPVFTPSTKSDEHDVPMSPDELIQEGIVDKDLLKKIEETGMKLFERGQEIASKQGFILVDTKYELGLDENGQLTLVDEIHTPDSSRYWQADSYQERLDQGLEPEYFDIVRKAMLEVFEGEHGTARWYQMDSIQQCGKTGTVQNPHGEDHSLFIAFAPLEKPEIAITVIVENAG